MDMGLGKTVITLSSIAHLIQQNFLKSVLVVGPIKVCRLVWRQEAAKWSHTKHLTFSNVTGTLDQRIRAILRPADVYLINFENLKWLAETLQTYFISKGKEIPFNGVVWDEVSKMKNSNTKRVHAVVKLLDKLVWRTGLTGTPAGNGYKDLHGQYLVVDQGKRLGTSKTAFQSRFYYKVPDQYVQVPFDHAEQDIKAMISDITIEMSAEDYNPLPDMIVNDIMVDFPSDLRAKYEQLEKEFFTKLDNVEIEVFNKAALTNKCLQFANGAVYTVPGLPMWERVHDLKLEALEDILDEANGNPVLCSYAFKSDAERIMKHFAKLRPINFTECKSQKSADMAMLRWKTGDCQLMIGHPESMGYGVDGLQDNGHILAHYGLNWSLTSMQQFNSRIRRQGQGKPSVICHQILVPDTLDMVQRQRLEDKDDTQTGLRKAVKEYRLMKGY